MSTLLAWIFTHAEWILVANLAAGCYGALWFGPEFDRTGALRSPLVRVTIVVVCAIVGTLLLVALIIADRIERLGHYYPPAPRRRG